MTITHTFQSVKTDGADNTLVQPGDWNAAHTLAAGYFLPQVATTVIENDEILTLPTSSVDVTPAPGAGKAIVIMGGVISTHVVAGGDYGGVGTPSYIGLCFQSGFLGWRFDGDDVGIFFEDDIIMAFKQDFRYQLEENIPVKLGSTNGGDFTGGNAANTFTVTVFYLVIDV